MVSIHVFEISVVKNLEKVNSSILARVVHCTGELGYDGPLYDGSLSLPDDMLGPSPVHIKYVSY